MLEADAPRLHAVESKPNTMIKYESLPILYKDRASLAQKRKMKKYEKKWKEYIYIESKIWYQIHEFD